MCIPFLFLVLIAVSSASPVSDYVIVGGGTAGCALAARLCVHLPHRQVILIERSKPLNATERLFIKSPRLAFEAQSSRLGEIFVTSPNPGLNNRTLSLITGNTIGGSSSINSAQWTVPPLSQVRSWGFRGLNAFRAAILYARAEGRTRPMQPPPSLRHELADEWLAAAEKVGFKIVEDPSKETPRDGVYYNSLTVSKSGMRFDSCTAYLKPVMDSKCKKNLRLVQGATVTKLLLSRHKRSYRTKRKCWFGKCRCLYIHRRQRRRVWGVQYVLASSPLTKRVLRAEQQVVVAAGPFGSPKLLQLSGIGSRAVLQKAGIPLLHELPVGLRVQSRVVGLVLSAYTGIPTVSDNNPAVVSSAVEREKFINGQGGLLGKGTTGINGRFSRDFYLGMSNAFSLSDAAAGAPLILSFCLAQPKSYGRISVVGTDPFAAPEINLNLLGGNGEAARMAVCLQKMRKLHQKLPKSLKSIEVNPGANVSITESVARENVQSAYHVVGGCAIGRVVDADFNVKGLDGLRVVDSSVIPEMPRQAGPMSSVYMLAELATELIRREDRC